MSNGAFRALGGIVPVILSFARYNFLTSGYDSNARFLLILSSVRDAVLHVGQVGFSDCSLLMQVEHKQWPFLHCWMGGSMTSEKHTLQFHSSGIFWDSAGCTN